MQNEFSLITERLILRPLRRNDEATLRTVLFEDPEVARGLHHDFSDPAVRSEYAQEWCRHLSVDSAASAWPRGGLGAFAIIPREDGVKERSTEFMGVIGCYDAELNGDHWSAEFFYALGSKWHGMGLMSEAVSAVLERLKEHERPWKLWADHWSILNPASGRILRKNGFSEIRQCSVSEMIGNARTVSLRNFELWRLEHADPAKIAETSRQVAIKMGHIVGEGLLAPEPTLRDLLTLSKTCGASPDDLKRAEAAFNLGKKTPAFWLLEWQGHRSS